MFDFCCFKLSVIETLISYSEAATNQRHSLPRKCGRNFLDYVPPTDKKSQPTKRCVFYSKVGPRKESCYQWEESLTKPGFCVVQWFCEYLLFQYPLNYKNMGKFTIY